MYNHTFVTSLSSEADETKKAPDKQSLMHWSDVATSTVFDPAVTKRSACRHPDSIQPLCGRSCRVFGSSQNLLVEEVADNMNTHAHMPCASILNFSWP